MSNRAERRRAQKLAAKGSRRHYESLNHKAKMVELDRKKQRPEQHSEVVADEKLLSCAIMHLDGSISKGFRSHYELRNSLGYEDPTKFVKGDIPGFWTSKERFVGRNAAMNIAFHAGQIRQVQQREFLSSDVDVW